jgi:hypothetical protein
MKLKVQYYRQQGADLTNEVPAEGFLGWAEKEIDVPIGQSALLVMHAWNHGLISELECGPGTKYEGWWSVVEYVPRAVRITREVLKPMLDEVRKTNLRIIHVGSTEEYCGKYPGYKRAKQLAGEEAPSPEGSVNGEWLEPYNIEKMGAENLKCIEEACGKHLDFPPETRPLDDEWVVINTHQLNALCRHLGIWNLVYTGFAINWCLWNSPGGMVDMHRLGYCCSTIPEATTAVENDFTAREELNKKSALWRVAVVYGYVIHLEDFIKGLRREHNA